MTALMAAATAALLGAPHCAAMCGPLAVVGCAGPCASSRRRRTLGYLVGRLLTYVLLGALCGHAGARVARALPVAWAQYLAVAIVVGVAAWRGVCLLRPTRPRVVSLPTARRPAATWLVSMLPRQGLGLGLATGILPCGLLVSGWMLAAGTAHPAKGAAVMLVFGLATLPGLVAPLVGRRVFAAALRRIPQSVVGALWLVFAAVLAARPFWASGAGCH